MHIKLSHHLTKYLNWISMPLHHNWHHSWWLSGIWELGHCCVQWFIWRKGWYYGSSQDLDIIFWVGCSRFYLYNRFRTSKCWCRVCSDHKLNIEPQTSTRGFEMLIFSSDYEEHWSGGIWVEASMPNPEIVCHCCLLALRRLYPTSQSKYSKLCDIERLTECPLYISARL